VRVTHDDGVELTYDNIVNNSSLYGSDVLNRIKKIDSFRKIESEYFFSESECCTFYIHQMKLVNSRNDFIMTAP